VTSSRWRPQPPDDPWWDVLAALAVLVTAVVLVLVVLGVAPVSVLFGE
jgi:hypothetical protein